MADRYPESRPATRIARPAPELRGVEADGSLVPGRQLDPDHQAGTAPQREHKSGARRVGGVEPTLWHDGHVT